MSLWTVAFIAVIVTEITADVRSRIAVSGSRQRYVWATIRRTCAYIVIAWFLILAVIDSATGDTFSAAIEVAIVVWNTWTEVKRGDDDDFWSQSWRKLKRKVRDLRRQVSLSPTPAFT